MNARLRPLLAAACVAALAWPLAGPVSAAPGVLATSEAAPAGAPETGTFEELLCAVILNGVRVADGVLVLRANGTYYAAESDLREWRLATAGGATLYGGTRFLSLTAENGIRAAFDPVRGELLVTAAARAFVPSTIDARALTALPAISPETGSGAFANYSLHGHAGSDGGSVGGLLELGAARAGSFITSTFVEPAHASFVRLDTTFESDRPRSLQSFRAGDFVSLTGSSAEFAGVQWATNFALDPSVSTAPPVFFNGLAGTPSTLDVYVNGVKTLSQPIGPGAFSVDNLPLIAGGGQIDFVMRDITGRQEDIRQGYYLAPTLLRRGLNQSAIEAGFLRSNYGIASNDYGAFTASGSLRRGLTDSLTAGAALALSSRLSRAALTADAVAGRAGEFSAEYDREAGASTGDRTMLSYSLSNREYSFGVTAIGTHANYQDPACSGACVQLRSALQFHVDARIGPRSNVSLGYSDQRNALGEDLRLISASASVQLHGGTVSIGLLHAGVTGPTGVTVSYIHQIGTRGSVYTSASVAGGPAANVQVAENLPPSGIGYAYRAGLTTGANGTDSASVTRQTTTGIYQLALQRAPGANTVDFDAGGSFGLIGGNLYRSRTIDASYGLAIIPDAANVRVYVNNQEAGRTNADGAVFLPGLQPYRANEVRVEPEDLPLAADIENSKIVVAPYAHSPLVVRFPVTTAGGVSIRLLDDAGKPLPAGTAVHVVGQSRIWNLAYDGQAYLEAVASGAHVFEAQFGPKTCSFDVVIPADITSQPDLGSVVCR